MHRTSTNLSLELFDLLHEEGDEKRDCAVKRLLADDDAEAELGFGGSLLPFDDMNMIVDFLLGNHLRHHVCERLIMQKFADRRKSISEKRKRRIQKLSSHRKRKERWKICACLQRSI